MRILLLEGDEQTATVVCNALEGEEYILDRAKNWESAWQLAKNISYNLTIVDSCIAETDSLGFCQQLRAKVNRAVVLLITPSEIKGSAIQEAELQIEIQHLKENLKSLGADNLVETIYGVGYRLNPAYLQPVSVTDSRKQQMRALVARSWERAKPNVLEQLSYIEKATQALLTNILDESTQKKAEQQAHKLAGSLGTFGLLQGSELAKKIETILESDLSVVHQQMHYLKKLVGDLHLLVEQTTAESLQSAKKPESLSLIDSQINPS
ncbi:response regulator [Merismopedia glauca]|uniref:HPt domain-containing protein n=1 Tax=Merismopedia glauca CCAP 1448/3 TaxID=1296344 RepID=A0A2T1BX69_9CYAN|nr:response regulator [Merismopedia glauca]PSB00524.1 hypothetical protein C7B64_23065 [Merismopedia glauca CCAP 1448/3]